MRSLWCRYRDSVIVIEDVIDVIKIKDVIDVIKIKNGVKTGGEENGNVQRVSESLY